MRSADQEKSIKNISIKKNTKINDQMLHLLWKCHIKIIGNINKIKEH